MIPSLVDRRTREHFRYRLTPEDIRLIRKLLAAGKMFPSEIAEMFGVSKRTIRSIQKGERWSDVT